MLWKSRCQLSLGSNGISLYPMELLQVVGHTPVRTALDEGNILSLDTFSTYTDGRPIGDENTYALMRLKRND